jgi:hypothetical protein
VTIKDILAKVTKGEQLTDEEKAVVAGFDPDGLAAAARKKAEADAAKALADAQAFRAQLDEAQAKLSEAEGKGKTDLEKLTAQVATLTQQVTAARGEKAKLVRQQKLDDVIRGSGLQFVPDVDGGIMRGALVKEFDGLTDEDLADAEKVKPIVGTFRARNKAVILDTTGHGAGGPAHKPGGTPEDRMKAIESMTPVERAAQLKKDGVI